MLISNPVSKELVIKGLTGTGVLTIATMNGIQFERFAISGTTLKTNVSHLPKGLYLVTYRYKEGIITSKLMIE